MSAERVPQIDELLPHAAKTSVFFIDDMQVVRPGGVGSAELIHCHRRPTRDTLVELELEAPVPVQRVRRLHPMD